MQKYKLISDVHLDIKGSEYIEFDLEEDDSDTILILSGDICEVSRSGKMLTQMTLLCARFKLVIHVLGNHCYYNGSLMRTPQKQKQAMAHLDNYILLHNEYIEIDRTIIMGSTLWTDMKKGCPIFANYIVSEMNDFKSIRTGTTSTPYTRRIRPNDIVIEHKYAVEFFDATLDKFKNRKRIVVSHHPPIEDCLDSKYEGKLTNPSYASSTLEEPIIMKYSPDIWISGHTHKAFDFTKHGTRFICMPRGYPREITGYDPNFSFKL